MKKNEDELVDNIHADGHPPDKLKTQNMKKQKSHSPELISRPLVTRASQENDAAKIQIKLKQCSARRSRGGWRGADPA